LNKGDFYNGCTTFARPTVGPREPWKDVHSCVRGPAVQDVLRNFVERWHRQASLFVEKLVDLQACGLEATTNDSVNEEERWSTQLFRSIDSRTAQFDADVIADFESPEFRDIQGVVFDNVVGEEDRNKRKSHVVKMDSFSAQSAEGFKFTRSLRHHKGKIRLIFSHGKVGLSISLLIAFCVHRPRR